MNNIQKYAPIFAHKENTENQEKEYIHFTEPYYRIAGKEQFKNQELNEVLSHSIYSSIQDNFDYIITTQYNTDKNNKYQVRKIERALEKIHQRNRSIPLNNPSVYQTEEGFTDNSEKVLNNSILKKLLKKNQDIKTHNILKHNKDNIKIIHYIPSLNTQEAIQLEILQNLNTVDNTKKDTMYNPKYNEYPPMNGLAYKNMLASNAEGYYTNTNHNQMTNPALQQQNVHGRNDLLLPEGSPPYGFYDQSNFAGTNSLMCGPFDAQNIRMIQKGQPGKESYRNEYPGSFGMPNMYQQPNRMYQPNMNNMDMNKTCEPMYMHETFYGQDICAQKNRALGNSSVNGKDKKELSRKNMSKLKKGMIDINIETSSSNRQGVTIDLNIGVGN